MPRCGDIDGKPCLWFGKYTCPTKNGGRQAHSMDPVCQPVAALLECRQREAEAIAMIGKRCGSLKEGIAGLQAEVDRHHELTLKLTTDLEQCRRELEQAQVQLAGCGVAALGGTTDPVKRGDYGWSPAYQDVLDLRLKYDQCGRERDGNLRQLTRCNDLRVEDGDALEQAHVRIEELEASDKANLEAARKLAHEKEQSEAERNRLREDYKRISHNIRVALDAPSGYDWKRFFTEVAEYMESSAEH